MLLLLRYSIKKHAHCARACGQPLSTRPWSERLWHHLTSLIRGCACMRSPACQLQSCPGSASHGCLRQALYGVLVRLQVHDGHAWNLQGHDPMSTSHTLAQSETGNGHLGVIHRRKESEI